jgi:hypothetical protein
MAEGHGVTVMSLLPMNPMSLAHEGQRLTPFRVSLSLCTEGQADIYPPAVPPGGRHAGDVLSKGKT